MKVERTGVRVIFVMVIVVVVVNVKGIPQCCKFILAVFEGFSVSLFHLQLMFLLW